MDESKNKKPSFWLILPAIIIAFTATAYLLNQFGFMPRFSASNSIKITNVQKTSYWSAIADAWVNGWKEVNYYTFRFTINIANSKTNDTSNLDLVVGLEVDNATVVSRERIITLLRAGESRNVLLIVPSVPDVYLYDDLGYSINSLWVITLYHGGEVLDQRLINQ